MDGKFCNTVTEIYHKYIMCGGEISTEKRNLDVVSRNIGQTTYLLHENFRMH
jgi:hypothetical protein